MSEARPGTSTPPVLRVIGDRRLQDIRLDTCASLEDAAQTLRVQTLTVRRPERGEVALRPLYADKLLETYGADRQVSDEFIDLAEQADEPDWWARYRDVVPATPVQFLACGPTDTRVKGRT
ncbi:hypothetical protein [Streptomyces seoulensis]|uniref:hypothetical protein n=1 Tax=Streptomyces seoulensis TaxID=73044 RepID=UPI001FCB3914|nr:hypothetical protein [Streptomyces seoulensis]BDH05838.1 hypothetical protein HEK131_30650 [Streptomyces seoulensis]